MTDTAVESTADEIGADLAPVAPAPSTTLFRTDDPTQVLERATAAADALKAAIKRAGLVSNIQGREYVRVEGWTTLASMLGVTPVCEWTREVDGGWEARVLAQTLDGRTIGAAEAQCTRSENTWKKRDDFALRSMAQTRATSKALRAPLGFVVTLAGYEATPAEEMTQVAHEAGQGNRGGKKITEAQRDKFIFRRKAQLGISDERFTALLKQPPFEVDDINDLPIGLVDELAKAMAEPLRTGESDIPAPTIDATDAHDAAEDGDLPFE